MDCYIASVIDTGLISLLSVCTEKICSFSIILFFGSLSLIMSLTSDLISAKDLFTKLKRDFFVLDE